MTMIIVSSHLFCCLFVFSFYIFYFIKELFESLDDNLDEDLLEALVALSLSTAQYDARTLNLAMTVSLCAKLLQHYLMSCREIS